MYEQKWVQKHQHAESMHWFFNGRGEWWFFVKFSPINVIKSLVESIKKLTSIYLNKLNQMTTIRPPWLHWNPVDCYFVETFIVQFLVGIVIGNWFYLYNLYISFLGGCSSNSKTISNPFWASRSIFATTRVQFRHVFTSLPILR